jgi:hypothetical protein
MKMSQVELVSVFMSVFSRYRVELVRMEAGGRKESLDEARRRVEGLMADSQSRLTLQINWPKEVEVRFVKRKR